MHNINYIFDIVQKETGINFEQLVSRSRNSDLVFARHLFTALARKGLFSFVSIGKALKRDHTTAIHSYEMSKLNTLIKEISKKYDPSEFTKDIINTPISIQINQRKFGNVYQKYNGKCVVCGFNDTVHIQYLVPPHLGGSEGMENMILLCPNHKSLVDKGMLEIKDINKIVSCPHP